MPTNFLAGLGSSLTERWATALFTPAFVFWLGGLFAWGHRFGWQRLETELTQLSEPVQITFLFLGLLIVVTSGFIVQRFDLWILRGLEGYWPTWLAPVRRYCVARQQRQWQRADNRWQELAVKRDRNGLTADETQAYITLDWQLRQVPTQPEMLMPTRLGNLLRASESRPSEKYGLDAVICWSRLWLVLPEEVKQELQAARAHLNTAAQIWLWGILFSIWTIWVWWAIPMALGVTLVAYAWILSAATTYSDLMEAAFDLHRMALYQTLHWPLPTNPAEERQLGQLLTEYLWRGLDQTQPKFTQG